MTLKPYIDSQGNPPIGVSGVATSGKDTFGNLLIEELAELGFTAKRYALADELKVQLRPFIFDMYKIDILNCTLEQKTFLRPLLVFHGEAMRNTSDGTYWSRLLDKSIAKDQQDDPSLIPIITDVRYAFYPNDEVYWIKQKYGLVVHVERYKSIRASTDKGFEFRQMFVPPANETEAKHDGAVIANCDYNLHWETSPDSNPVKITEWCRQYVKDFLEYPIMSEFLSKCTK